VAATAADAVASVVIIDDVAHVDITTATTSKIMFVAHHPRPYANVLRLFLLLP
jgi:hypothetical protein